MAGINGKIKWQCIANNVVPFPLP